MVDSDQWDTIHGRKPYEGPVRPTGMMNEPTAVPDSYQKSRYGNRNGVLSYAALIRFEQSQTRSWFTKRHG